MKENREERGDDSFFAFPRLFVLAGMDGIVFSFFLGPRRAISSSKWPPPMHVCRERECGLGTDFFEYRGCNDTLSLQRTTTEVNSFQMKNAEKDVIAESPAIIVTSSSCLLTLFSQVHLTYPFPAGRQDFITMTMPARFHLLLLLLLFLPLCSRPKSEQKRTTKSVKRRRKSEWRRRGNNLHMTAG